MTATAAATKRRITHIGLTECGAGRDLPMGLIIEVSKVLEFHGVEAPVVDLMMALARVVDRTPVEQGGRLRTDGTVDREVDQ